MKLTSLVRGFLVVSAMLHCAERLHAQKDDPLLDRLHSASNAATLTDEEVDPFYLKIDVQLYDDKGKPSEKGTIEDWWAGNGTEKTVYTTPSYTATQVRKGDQIFRSAGASFPPYLLSQLLLQVVEPLPYRSNIDALKVTEQKFKFGSVPLECIAVQPDNKQWESPSNYCFDPGKDSLRLVLYNGGQLFIHNGIGKFEQKEVPVDVAIRIGGIAAATGHISALMSRPVPALAVSTEGLTKLPQDAMQGGSIKLLRSVPPTYPTLAQQQRLSGEVAVHAVIGTDGHVLSTSIYWSSAPVFNNAALAAVSHYLFQILVVEGAPQKFEIIIEVNFQAG